jgi:cell division protein FtsI/penicillin-binding protein 2
MGSLGLHWARNLLFLCLLSVPAYCQQAQSPNSPPASLFSQSAIQILQLDYTKSGTSYLLLDVKTGGVLASHWNNSEKAIPMGSLVKPFTALAYAEAHDFRYPIYECKGKSSGCWQARPHGNLDITAAVSVSCNAYFRRLAQNVTLEQLRPVALAFGLEFPDAESTSSTLLGLGDQWRISPIQMAQAFLELDRRRNQPGVSPILEGMRQSAQRGTGAAVDRQLKHGKALVKTGTAPCTHSPWAPADGFVVALVPEDQPEILLFVRIHGVAGAKAAETAGQMLRQMEE